MARPCDFTAAHGRVFRCGYGGIALWPCGGFTLGMARYVLFGDYPALAHCWLRQGMQETARFTALEEERKHRGLTRPAIFEPLRHCVEPTAGPWAGRMLLVS